MDRCAKIDTPHGPKDLEIYNNYIISAYGDRIHHGNSGGIISITLEGKANILPIKDYPEDRSFHPFGIHISEKLLYVVNVESNTKSDSIECLNILEVDEGIEIVYNRSIVFEDPYYNQINDIYFVNSTLFYATVSRSVPGFEPLGYLKIQIGRAHV